MTQTPLEKIREEITSRQDPQSLRLMCGELSSNEVLTAQALMKWMLRICEKHLQDTRGSMYRDLTIGAINQARRSHPDSVSCNALNTAEREIRKGFAHSNQKDRTPHV
ncbi:hypothetical protein [Pseudosulfitobacter pseudonitzschiae]|uniref:hypothetical protein n=1 Tax=Pseudosulfitobacter pseudonitzschiae TaxID=1402135 RepID=UPI003B7C902A